MKYYTLVCFDETRKFWYADFGDHDRDVVVDELYHREVDEGFRHPDSDEVFVQGHRPKIIETETKTYQQLAIARAVAELNK